MTKGIWNCLAVVALLVFVSACATAPTPERCALLKTAADQACSADVTSQGCVAAGLAYAASGCGSYVAPKCPDLPEGKVKCDADTSCDCVFCSKGTGFAWEEAPACPKCPATCPEGQWCTDPKVGCVTKPEDPPPPVCPTCPEGYSCKDPKVGCVKDPTPPPTTYCQSPLNPALLPPVYADADWTDAGVDQNPRLTTQVKAAIKRAQEKCPLAWANDQCLMRGPAGIDDAYRDVARELQASGIVAGQGTNDNNPKADHLTIERATEGDVFEEWKLFSYGNGCLTQNQFKGAVRPKAGAEPPPVEPPDNTYGCPAPVPPRLWTAETLPSGWGEDMIGKPRFEIKAKIHNPNQSLTDSTPVVAPRACEYCASIGMGEMGPGVPRCGCPVRPDGHPDRVACENVLVVPPQGKTGPKWVKVGSKVAIASCEVAPDTEPCVTDNPYQALTRGHEIQACSWDDAVCSPVVK